MFHTRYQQCGSRPGARAGRFNPGDFRSSGKHFQNKRRNVLLQTLRLRMLEKLPETGQYGSV